MASRYRKPVPQLYHDLDSRELVAGFNHQGSRSLQDIFGQTVFSGEFEYYPVSKTGQACPRYAPVDLSSCDITLAITNPVKCPTMGSLRLCVDDTETGELTLHDMASADLLQRCLNAIESVSDAGGLEIYPANDCGTTPDTGDCCKDRCLSGCCFMVRWCKPGKRCPITAMTDDLLPASRSVYEPVVNSESARHVGKFCLVTKPLAVVDQWEVLPSPSVPAIIQAQAADSDEEQREIQTVSFYPEPIGGTVVFELGPNCYTKPLEICELDRNPAELETALRNASGCHADVMVQRIGPYCFKIFFDEKPRDLIKVDVEAMVSPAGYRARLDLRDPEVASALTGCNGREVYLTIELSNGRDRSEVLCEKLTLDLPKLSPAAIYRDCCAISQSQSLALTGDSHVGSLTPYGPFKFPPLQQFEQPPSVVPVSYTSSNATPTSSDFHVSDEVSDLHRVRLYGLEPEAERDCCELWQSANTLDDFEGLANGSLNWLDEDGNPIAFTEPPVVSHLEMPAGYSGPQIRLFPVAVTTTGMAFQLSDELPAGVTGFVVRAIGSTADPASAKRCSHFDTFELPVGEHALATLPFNRSYSRPPYIRLEQPAGADNIDLHIIQPTDSQVTYQLSDAIPSPGYQVRILGLLP